MNNNINIGTFDFDDNKMLERIIELNKEIDKLYTAMEIEKKMITDLNNEYKKNEATMKRYAEANKTNSKEYEELARRQQLIVQQIGEYRSRVSSTGPEVTALRSELKKLNEIVEINAQRTRILSEEYTTEGKSVRQLREERSLLLKIRNEEIATNGAQTEAMKALNRMIEENTNREKSLVSETEQRYYQIGDYANQLKGQFSSVTDAIKQIGSGDVIGGVDALKGSVRSLTASMMALVATPIGAVVTALAGFAVVAKYIYDYNTEMAKATKLTQEFTGLVGAELEDVTVRAKNFSEQTSTDMKEVIRTVNAVANAYNLSYGQAFDLVEKGYAKAGQSAEDFFDNTDEYIQQFKNAGYSADEFFSILESGAKNGTYKDKIVDNIKEMDLRLKEFNKSTSDSLVQAFGQDFTNKLEKGLKTGTITTKDAIKQIADESDKLGLNFQQKQRLVAGVFGAMGEDAGGFVKVLDTVQDGINNSNRELTELEQAQLNVIKATNEYEQAFADLFNLTGGGFEMMKANFKSIIFEYMTKAIRTIIDFANGFVDVYNNSLALRGGVQAVSFAVQTLGRVFGFTFKTMWDGLKSVGDLFVGILTLDADRITKAIQTPFKSFTNNVVDLYKNTANSAMDAYEATINGRMSKIEASSSITAGGEATEAGVGGREVIGSGDKKKEKAEKKAKEAKDDLDNALKLNERYISDLAKLYFKQGQDEISHQIKLNSEKIKNAKVLTDEMLAIERNRLKLENDLRLESLANEKKEADRLADEENKASLRDIENLKVAQSVREELILNANNLLEAKLRANEQAYNNKTLENMQVFENQKLELEDVFRQNRQALEEQRQLFDFDQRMLQIEAEGNEEEAVRMLQLEKQFSEEKKRFRQMLNDKVISQDEYNGVITLLEENNARERAEIERILQHQRLSIIGDTLGSISSLLGETTASGKAFGAAQALINTWLGVTDVWRTPSTLPEPFATIAKVGSTATVLASGLKAVQNIKKVNVTGRGISGGGGASSLGTTSTTYKSDYAGGAIKGLDGNSKITGYTERETFGGERMTSEMREAVRSGAREGARDGAYSGSQKGFKDLSTDRTIQENAKY